MYGKFFKSAFSGSMMAAGPEVFAVWGYVIAHAVDSRVELNPMLLAAVIGSTPDRMQDAIDRLCAPDPDSRSPECDGRRMVKEGQFQYFIVNHAKYRSIRNEDERREYNRIKKQEERARKADVKVPVIDSQRKSSVSAHTEADTETDVEAIHKAARKRSASSRKRDFLSLSDLVALGVDRQHAEDWLRIRAAKRAPLTSSAWALVVSEAAKAGMTPAEAVEQAASHSWIGFKAAWVSEKAGSPRSFRERDSDHAKAVADAWMGSAKPKKLDPNVIDMEDEYGPRLALG